MHLLRKLLFLVLQAGAVPTKDAHALAATPTCKTQTLKNDGAKKIFGMSLLQAPMASAHQAVTPVQGNKEIRPRDDDDDDDALEAELQELERLSSDLRADLYPTRQHTKVSATAYSTTANPELLLEQIPTNPSPSPPDSLATNVGSFGESVLSNLSSSLRSLENDEFSDGWRIVIIGFCVLPIVLCFSTCLRSLVTWLITITSRQHFNLIILPTILVWISLTFYFWRWEKSGALTRALQDPMVMTIIVVATFLLPFTFLITFVIYTWVKPYLFAALDLKRKCVMALEKFIQRDLNGDGKIESTYISDMYNFMGCGSEEAAAAPAVKGGGSSAGR